MGGEDFAAYLAHAPGCMMRLGVASDDRPRHPLHSPYFDVDERALAIGAKILARSVVLLSEQGRRP
jgi:amidohydrolase